MFSNDQVRKIKEISKLSGDEQAIELNKLLSELSPEQIGYLKTRQCVFCMIASKQIDSMVVYEDNENIAVMDINPAGVGHVIVIPKKHVAYYWAAGNSLDNVVRSLAASIVNSVNAEGINIMIANGAAAGQNVAHLGVHLIPRFKGDGINLNLKTKMIKKEDMEKIANEIRKRLSFSRKSSFKKTLEKTESFPNPSKETFPKSFLKKEQKQHEFFDEEERIP